MNRIRLAKPEEVEVIKTVSDLDATCMVLALDTAQGAPIAVIRTAIEVDPVIYPTDLHDRMKAVFQRDIETVLAAKGVAKYYFNVHVSNTAMLEVAKTLGAVQVSSEPEFRFEKVL